MAQIYTLSLVGLCLLACISLVSSLENCSGENAVGSLVKFEVSGCDLTSNGPCKLIRGTKAKMTMDFQSNKKIIEANLKVYGKVLFIKLPFPIEPENACGNYGFDCPIEAGETKRLTLDMEIKKFYPAIGVGVEVGLQDEQGDTIACVQFPAELSD